MRILIVEDDGLLADGLTQGLRREGHAADCVASAERADAVLREQRFDLLVLDIGLPGMDGLELLRRLRARGEALPVLVLTARDALSERVHGLNLGADDYMTKPFAMEELAARVAALARRGRSLVEPRREHGGLVVDVAAHRAWLQGAELDLPAREWAILSLLLDHVERVVSKERIVAHCAPGEGMSANAIEVYVSRLRARLEPAGIRIRTVRGIGYMLMAADGP